MKQPKETTDVMSPTPRFRFWSTPPQTVCVSAAALDGLIPPANRLAPFDVGQTVELPADEIFSSSVPKIGLSRLADLLPLHVKSGDGKITLPVSALALSYALLQHTEEIPTPLPELEVSATDVPFEEPAPATETLAIPLPPHTAYEIARLAPVPSEEQPPAPQVFAAPVPPPPMVNVPPPSATQRIGKVPEKRTIPFAGLPMFRRKPVPLEPTPPPPVAPLTPPSTRFVPVMRMPSVPQPQVDLAPIEPYAEPEPAHPAPIDAAPEPTFAELSFAEPKLVEPESVFVEPLPEPALAPVPEIAPAPAPEIALAPLPSPVRILETEHLVTREPVAEIDDNASMQALFLTEEKLTVARVIELCSELPGIHSCVLAHETVVVAAHNAPTNVDLISLSAHASEMLATMRASTARMGVGTVPAVTLHTEKGVISFFHRDDLTMLVFHKDRGFVPGVREKMASVLGELTKARLTLPAGDDNTDGTTRRIS